MVYFSSCQSAHYLTKFRTLICWVFEQRRKWHRLLGFLFSYPIPTWVPLIVRILLRIEVVPSIPAYKDQSITADLKNLLPSPPVSFCRRWIWKESEINAVLLCTQLLFPSPCKKNIPLLAFGGESEASFFFLHSNPGFSVTVLLHLLASGLCPLPSPLSNQNRRSYPLGHCDWFGSEHLTQAGPIRILFRVFFPNSMGGTFVCLSLLEES